MPMLRHIADVTIELVQGDITKAQVDAIVNAANNHFWMGGGVAGAIKRAGGSEIEAEAISKGPAEVGDAVVTQAGRLPMKHVIHAAVMGQDLATDAAKIRKATRSTLKRAQELGLESIAFPAFGTGIGGFSPDRAADAMLAECISLINGGSSPKLKKILFVLFSEDILTAFERKLQAMTL